jgi:hypothetical protein
LSSQTGLLTNLKQNGFLKWKNHAEKFQLTFTNSTYPAGLTGCAAFGHSCFGGHGKRALAIVRDPEPPQAAQQAVDDDLSTRGAWRLAATTRSKSSSNLPSAANKHHLVRYVLRNKMTGPWASDAEARTGGFYYHGADHEQQQQVSSNEQARRQVLVEVVNRGYDGEPVKGWRRWRFVNEPRNDVESGNDQRTPTRGNPDISSEESKRALQQSSQVRNPRYNQSHLI